MCFFHFKRLNRTHSQKVTETQICQTELDRATDTFKQLHQERQNLINQWEAAIKNMQKSDQNISSAQTQYQTLKVFTLP